MKKADIGVALYLLAAVIFFIVPISSTLLDVMLALNISIALIVLFNTLFVKEVLDMSFFPTLLLFTTIFRISLNVSSTRLILTTGAPGNVVQTFGQFVDGVLQEQRVHSGNRDGNGENHENDGNLAFIIF